MVKHSTNQPTEGDEKGKRGGKREKKRWQSRSNWKGPSRIFAQGSDPPHRAGVSLAANRGASASACLSGSLSLVSIFRPRPSSARRPSPLAVAAGEQSLALLRKHTGGSTTLSVGAGGMPDDYDDYDDDDDDDDNQSKGRVRGCSRALPPPACC
ncbi:hypothetical protein CSOJ01_01560 [Colletotrichum sojae]|uniref:Uncharacterized protein n=1 Tax=Colletotrichum sojae TaxID=2175907 RepID=A0A8H6JUE0_9PEZI|nr:hypothetical protein CSOJ01_01560 [Colletotrichum sojae]